MAEGLNPAQLTQMSFLGCALMEPKQCRDSILRLSPAMFEEGMLRDLFAAIYRLTMAGRGIDPLTVDAEMGGGGRELILRCAEQTPKIEHAGDYEQLIVEEYRRERLSSVCLAVTLDHASGSDKLCAQLAAELRKQNAIRGTMLDQTAREWDDIVDETIAALGEPDNSLKTDWKTVDQYGLFQRDNVVVIAGRPGGGKTDFSLTLATRLSKRYRVYYLTLEETRVRLMVRILSKVTRIDHARIRDKAVDEDEMCSLRNAAAALKRHHNMVIDQGSGMTVGTIRAKILKYRPDVVFVDHCGLIVGEDARQQRVEVIAQATNTLKAMAKEMGIVVVELVQLKRTVDRSGGVRAATLADLKGSGTYEEDANAVLFVESGEEAKLQGADAYMEVPIRIEKNRDGGRGRFTMYWQPQYHDWSPVRIPTDEELADEDPFEQTTMGG